MDTETFLRTTLTDMPIDSETTIGIRRHGRTVAFRVQRTANGWREQNDLYGMEDGAYGLEMDLDAMIAEIDSILDK